MSQVVTILTADVITATGQSGAFNVGENPSIDVEVEVTAASGTTPSCQFSVLWSDDGTHWAAEPDDVGSALTAVGNAIATIPVRGALFALAYAVSGTTPSFTVNAQAYV